VELWSKLRSARASVDAHFFANSEISSSPARSPWPEQFFVWARLNGLLTDQPRVPLKGMVYLDGRTLPHGYVILTPVDFVGAGPIVARVFNSTFNAPIGQFSVPAGQGPIAGRYKVDVRQNMNRWLSNSFSGGLVSSGRGGGPITPEQAHFGHHRLLAPSIDDQKSFTKVRPTDRDDYLIEIKPDAGANLDVKIEVFSGAAPVARVEKSNEEAPGGILGGPKNPGQVAYVEQIKAGAHGAVANIPEPILLWPSGAPEAVPDANGVFTDEDKPALYAFPAKGPNATNLAFLIIPGGAFTNRCMDNEGVQVARFLNRHGISGFVLRYRIGPNYPRRTISTMDAHRAMRYIRAHAAEYKIAPDRIGTIGFSAGAELQGDAFYNGVAEGDPTAADPLDRLSTRANFCALIYGGRNLQNPASAPPTFLFNTIEDAGHLNVQVSVLNSLRQAKVPVEAHFYQVGPHGTALSPGDPQLGHWPELMLEWTRKIYDL
jgi:acetyl esterase/lipase